MKSLTTNIAFYGIASMVFAGSAMGMVVFISSILHPQGAITLSHAKLLLEHNRRITSVEERIEKLNSYNTDLMEYVDRTIESTELKASSRIYNLEITICRTNKIENVIEKRKVRVNNVVAINPTLGPVQEPYLDTGLGYNQRVEIPDAGLFQDPETYACELKILSIK